MGKAKPLVFAHQIIDPCTPGTKNDICLIGDLNGDGRKDILIAGKYGENNLVWYETPPWERHVIGTTHVEAGGVAGAEVLLNGVPRGTPPCRIDRIPAGEVVLEVVDNGRGFDAQKAARGGGLGWVGMRERAAAVGGHWRMENMPEGGVCVTAELPLVQAPSN